MIAMCHYPIYKGRGWIKESQLSIFDSTIGYIYPQSGLLPLRLFWSQSEVESLPVIAHRLGFALLDVGIGYRKGAQKRHHQTGRHLRWQQATVAFYPITGNTISWNLS